MAKILIHKNPTCYLPPKKSSMTNDKYFDDYFGFNVCNRLFWDACYSHLMTPNNSISFLDNDYTADYINHHFDYIVYPEANLFSLHYIQAIKNITEQLKKYKIPVFVLGLGCSYRYGLIKRDKRYASFAQHAKQYLHEVYRTGGCISVRGAFTQELINKLGFGKPFISGCPSMYQFGPKLYINKPNLTKTELKPIICGHSECFQNKFFNRIFTDFKNAYYVDQDEFRKKLIKNKFFHGLQWFNKFKSIKEQVLASRATIFADMQQWRDFIKFNHFNFSFGMRIHGNVNALLAGIPACVWVHDDRTLELAKFYHIPYLRTYNGGGGGPFGIYTPRWILPHLTTIIRFFIKTL